MKRVLALLLLLGTSAAADVVVLKDGSRLEGQLSGTGATLMITLADGSSRHIDTNDVKSIQKTSTPVVPETELASLRRQIASATQPGLAVARLREFIARHPGTPAAADAQKDLNIWQHRADGGLVRFGEEWLTPEQFAAAKSKSGPAIENIRNLLADEKPAEAQKAIVAALKDWPGNSTLQFLNGVMLYRAKQLNPARQAFVAAAVDDSSNPAIHNNLAVILWQTHQQAGALTEYDRAMVGDVLNQTILDNVHEALHEAPVAIASSEIGQRVSSRFTVLDAKLRAMTHQHRYGSEWLDDDEFTRRSNHDFTSRDLVASYGQHAHRIQLRLAEIDRIIDEQIHQLRIIDQHSNIVMPDGEIMHYERPKMYQDLVRSVADLKLEKIMKTRELQALPKQLADAKTNPGPRWSSAQVLIESDSAVSATTQPAVRPPVEPLMPTTPQ